MAILASGIAHVPHLAAFDDMVKDRLEALDLSALLVYVVDTVPASALYYLASQFDVLGHKGWNLAQTDADRRTLIKKAIELHRYKGTIWAIKEAVRSVGFTDCQVIEHVGIDYNGLVNYDGSADYSGGFWANFRVKIGLNNSVVVDESLVDLVRNLILEYKNVRSFLVDVSYTTALSDSIGKVDDDIHLTITTDGVPATYDF